MIQSHIAKMSRNCNWTVRRGKAAWHRCGELEVQVESRPKNAGSPKMLDMKSALLEAPVSKGSVVTAVRT